MFYLSFWLSQQAKFLFALPFSLTDQRWYFKKSLFLECLSTSLPVSAIKMGRPRKLLANWELTGASSGLPYATFRDTGDFLTWRNESQSTQRHDTQLMLVPGNTNTRNLFRENVSSQNHEGPAYVCNPNVDYRFCNGANVKYRSFARSSFDMSPGCGKGTQICRSGTYNFCRPGGHTSPRCTELPGQYDPCYTEKTVQHNCGPVLKSHNESKRILQPVKRISQFNEKMDSMSCIWNASQHPSQSFKHHFTNFYGNIINANNVKNSNMLNKDSNTHNSYVDYNKHKFCNTSNNSIRQIRKQSCPVPDIYGTNNYNPYERFDPSVCQIGSKTHGIVKSQAQVPDVPKDNNLHQRYLSLVGCTQLISNRQAESLDILRSQWRCNYPQQAFVKSRFKESNMDSAISSNQVPQPVKTEPTICMSQLSRNMNIKPNFRPERCARGNNIPPSSSNYEPWSYNQQQDILCAPTFGDNACLQGTILPQRRADESAASSSPSFCQDIDKDKHIKHKNSIKTEVDFVDEGESNWQGMPHLTTKGFRTQERGWSEYPNKECNRKRKIDISTIDFDKRKQAKTYHGDSKAYTKQYVKEEIIETRNVCPEISRDSLLSPIYHSKTREPPSVNHLYTNEKSFQAINTIFASDDDLNDAVFRPFNYSPSEVRGL